MNYLKLQLLGTSDSPLQVNLSFHLTPHHISSPHGYGEKLDNVTHKQLKRFKKKTKKKNPRQIRITHIFMTFFKPIIILGALTQDIDILRLVILK